MKGYFTEDGYKGLVDGEYMLFESQSAYLEYISETKEEDNES